MGHFNWESGEKDTYFAGPCSTFQEPIFIPKSGEAVEGEGYLMGLVNHLDVLRNDIFIFDALNVGQGPVCIIHLPVKLRLGLHGNFVEQKELDDWAQRRSEGGEVGPQKPAEGPMKWQKDRLDKGEYVWPFSETTNGANGTNGANEVNGHSTIGIS